MSILAAGALVLVELFTSEGCSSCPPADELLRRLAQEPGVVAIEEHVDYWDYLGWKDPFSQAFFSDRQRDYARAFGRSRIYTPQMVVDGAEEFVGSEEEVARAAIARAQPKQVIELSLEAGELVARVPPLDEPAELFLAVAEAGLSTKVDRGENAGRTLLHAPVARVLKKLDVPRLKLSLGPRQQAVVFAQSLRTRRVLAIGVQP